MADGHEHPVGGEVLGGIRLHVAKANAADGPVAEHLVHLGVPPEVDLVVVERSLLHDLGSAKLVAPVNHGDLLGETRQEQGLFHRGISSADHDQLLVPEEESVACGAGRHAVAEQPVLAGDAQHAGGGAGGHDHRMGTELLVTGPDPERRRGEIDLGGCLVEHLRVEAGGLLLHELHELRAQDPFGEAGVVLHLGGQHQLAPGLQPLEHQWLEVRPGGVERRGETRGARADDHDVPFVHSVGHCPACPPTVPTRAYSCRGA
jgi:hypothetical protein